MSAEEVANQPPTTSKPAAAFSSFINSESSHAIVPAPLRRG